ncbi:MarR family winged helix-turn-helix transcriptional regulator [candidate division CSSED10-310 bacterium]|uniref:MarR family winged helix-turn-helix transcriptional regulator n=1 Tax=candidate division CSSED10-310 bacterium TaxID=2855610 RepID=A0ABV6YXP4_UNCC1
MTLISPPDCLYYLISRSTLVATSILKQELATAGVGHVKPAYLGVLLTLWRENGLQVSVLGRRAGLEPSTMTSLIDRMERDGIIVRRADPHDRRAQRIFLTAEGQKIQNCVLEVVDRMLSRVTKGITESEISQVKDILRRFIANIHPEK